jgi:eukaryotic-like serine/threonine-protein kinase
MSAESWAAVKALFDQIVELEPESRAERLAMIGRDDPSLRCQLERLLAADAEADHRLGRLEPLARLASLGSLQGGARSDSLELTGRVMSHFTLVERLGSGGMGVVYRAEDTRLGRQVAIKVPHAEYRHDEAWKERFLQEARAAAALDHPNLCVIHEVGEDASGRPFLAMPLYRGETLKERLTREGPLRLDDALAIAGQVAAGLSSVHAAGIVHRDLKPANIMLLPDGTVKILDFGLAKVRDLSITGAGARLGTVAYMAPEQVRDDPVDDRADRWALGVVLYEMTTGRRPFSGEHDVSLAHAIIHRKPELPSTLRPGLPRGLDRFVLALLDKDPAARPSESQLQAALGDLADGLSPRIAGRRFGPRAVAVVVGVLVVAGVAVALSRWTRAHPASGGDPNLLAVAPFDVLDSSLQLWREGMVDILSRDLDGAGPIRAVSQTLALKRWSGRADPASAARLGERTGAGLVVFGSVLSKGPDSVSLRAAVLDRVRGTTAADLELVGDERHIGELADSLGFAILRALGRVRPIASVRQVSLGSRSLPALREFLQGEQFYRRGMWDSALAHYDRSVAEDSSFGLPLFRMSRVLGWGPRTSRAYRDPGEYETRAVRLTQGLAPRDSLIFAFDAAAVAAGVTRDPDSLLAAVALAVATLEEAGRRYPDDPEIWYELGEMRTHETPPFGHDPARAFAAFQRVIALDPGFTPGYEHVVELAMQIMRPDLARRYARAYAALRPADAGGEDLRLTEAILDSGGVSGPGIAARLRSASLNTLALVGDHLAWWPDSAAVVVLREALAGGHDPTGAPGFAADSVLRQRNLAAALALRGRLREAAAMSGPMVADPVPPLSPLSEDPFLDLTLLGLVPDSVARAVFALSLSGSRSWTEGFLVQPPRSLLGLPWWLAHGDTASIARFGRRAAEVAHRPATLRAALRGRYFAAAAPAYLVLAKGDSARAVELFEAIPDTLCLGGRCYYEKLTLARLLSARGEDRAAAALLDRWGRSAGKQASSVFAELERGRVAERLGDRDRAEASYRFVAEVWQHADPELRRYVEEARAGLGRLASLEP